MSIVEPMNIIEQPPKSIAAGDFSDKAHMLYASPGHQPPTGRTLRQLERAYRRLDPLYPLTLDERESSRLVSAFDLGALTCEARLAAPKGKLSPKQREKTLVLHGELLIDKATLALRLPEIDNKQIVSDMEQAEDAFDQTKALRKGEDTYGHHTIGALFGKLSARAMGLHAEALGLSSSEAGTQFTGMKRTLLRKRVAGLAINGVAHMRAMSDTLNEMTGESGNERGRFMEMTAFTRETMRWYDRSDPAQAMVRFAVEREDRPRVPNVPRRGFDLLLRNAQTFQPLQVKVGSGVYHDSIDIWKPVRPDDVMDATGLVVDTFETALDTQAPYADVKRARLLIETQFQHVSNTQK